MEEETPVPFKQYFPKLSMSSFFWLIIGASGLFFGILGYFVGFRVNELPFSASSLQPSQPVQQSQVSSTADDNDEGGEFAEVFGTFTTDTSYYDQLDINVDSIKNGVKTNEDADYRYITKPQAGIAYPYSFQRLDPTKTYILSPSACTTNPKTYALICAKHIKITKCTGTIQRTSCIVKTKNLLVPASNEVDFSIKQ